MKDTAGFLFSTVIRKSVNRHKNAIERNTKKIVY